MLKVLINSRISIRLCQCQLLPTKFMKSSKSRFHYPRRDPRRDPKQRNIKLEFRQLPNYVSSNIFGFHTLPRFYCTTIDLDDNANENEGLEEMLDESHEYLENGFTQIKDFLYGGLSVDDDLLVEISNCNSADEVRIFVQIIC